MCICITTCFYRIHVIYKNSRICTDNEDINFPKSHIFSYKFWFNFVPINILKICSQTNCHVESQVAHHDTTVGNHLYGGRMWEYEV